MKNYKFLQEIVSEILKKQLFYNVRCSNVRNTQKTHIMQTFAIHRKRTLCKHSQHTEIMERGEIT